MIARRFAGNATVALIVLAVIGIARPAAADNPSPASILIAKEIIEIKGVKTMFAPLVRGVVDKTRDMFLQTNFMWAKDINEVAGIAHKEFDPRVNELIDVTARIYASHFTEQELKTMLTFYQSPLGRKMI